MSKVTKAAKRAAAIREAVADEVQREFELKSQQHGYHTLLIRFENRSVSIPFQPWKPSPELSLPGRWVLDDDPERA